MGTNVSVTCSSFLAYSKVASFGQESNPNSLSQCPARPTLLSVTVLDEIADKFYTKFHGLFFFKLMQRLRQQVSNNSTFAKFILYNCASRKVRPNVAVKLPFNIIIVNGVVKIKNSLILFPLA